MGLWHSLAQQFRQPSGFIGRIAGLLFRINREGIDWTITLLEIQPTDHVLEIGFGPGHGIQRVAQLAAQGRVAGMDFSETMLQQASRRNAAAIASGRVELRLGDASALPYPDNSFHKVFATNVVYFWNDPRGTLHEIRRVMKPGGRLALYVISKEDIANFKVTQTGLYTLYTGEDLVRRLTQAGFHQARFVTKAERLRTGVCALAEK
ncbi:MAG: class I SAM-dependent methyltransferase [Nitrospiraceae bacterium]